MHQFTMHRYLLRLATLAAAATLLLGGCRDNADPVKPKVAQAAALPASAGA